MSLRAVVVCVAGLVTLSGAGAQELNTASRAELEQLNGIGVTMAERILAERERAPFKSWNDLEGRVKGMKGSRTQRLQAQGVTVNGERESHPEKSGERK
jgi:competence protein ComEA